MHQKDLPRNAPARRKPGWGGDLSAEDAALMDRLLLLLDRLQEEKRVRWNRSVSVGDLLTDRETNAARLGFGKGSTVYDSALILGDVSVGEGSWVGPGTILDGGAAPIRIGSTVSISAGVHVYTHNAVAWAVTGGKAPYLAGKVTIGDRVFVGPQSVISLGVELGSGSIVGANSFVKHSFPAGSFVAGSPAKLKGRVVVDGDKASIVPLDVA